jgi:hypothetical protein
VLPRPGRGLPPLSPFSASGTLCLLGSGQVSLDEAERFLVFRIVPECRSGKPFGYCSRAQRDDALARRERFGRSGGLPYNLGLKNLRSHAWQRHAITTGLRAVSMKLRSWDLWISVELHLGHVNGLKVKCITVALEIMLDLW